MAVSENPYDQIAYRTFPRRQTHPDRPAAIATLFGMRPAAVTACRVLEIGCGDGANLIPLAFHLPGSRFTGIDLAAAPIAAGQAMARTLGLENIELRVQNLCELHEGEFDYIFAHGLYSWIPAAVRDRLLAVCRERLAPEGVAFVSYNVYPGRYPRQMIREILLYHTRGISDPAEKITAARALLPELDHAEAKALAELGDDSLFHDDLAPINDPVWFHEFAAHARRHGLQYLGEADSHKTFHTAPDGDDIIFHTAPDTGAVIEREQQVDFRKLRRFRQTLLCREEIVLDRRIPLGRLDEFLYSDNLRGQSVEPGEAALEAVVQALADTAPLPAAFADLVAYAGSVEVLRDILFAMLRAGCVNLHVYDFPCEETVTARPRASRLVRHQAAMGGNVTNACHLPVELDEVGRRLAGLLDGSRGHEEIARDLAKMAGGPEFEEVRRHLGSSLEWFARMGLLDG
jgi:SAM-dependent methyltransferase